MIIGYLKIGWSVVSILLTARMYFEYCLAGYCGRMKQRACKRLHYQTVFADNYYKDVMCKWAIWKWLLAVLAFYIVAIIFWPIIVIANLKEWCK